MINDIVSCLLCIKLSVSPAMLLLVIQDASNCLCSSSDIKLSVNLSLSQMSRVDTNTTAATIILNSPYTDQIGPTPPLYSAVYSYSAIRLHGYSARHRGTNQTTLGWCCTLQCNVSQLIGNDHSVRLKGATLPMVSSYRR